MRSPRDLPGLLRLGRLAFRQRHDLQEAAFLFTTSAKQYLDEHFDDEMVKSALGWESISNTLAGPSTPGTAYGLLHEAASGGSGGGVGWGFVRGGMGTVTALMADAAREAGAEIRTGAEVEQVRIAGGRATGVVLADGEEVDGGARAVQRGPQAHVPRLGRAGSPSRPASSARWARIAARARA